VAVVIAKTYRAEVPIGLPPSLSWPFPSFWIAVSLNYQKTFCPVLGSIKGHSHSRRNGPYPWLEDSFHILPVDSDSPSPRCLRSIQRKGQKIKSSPSLNLLLPLRRGSFKSLISCKEGKKFINPFGYKSSTFLKPCSWEDKLRFFRSNSFCSEGGSSGLKDLSQARGNSRIAIRLWKANYGHLTREWLLFEVQEVRIPTKIRA